MSRLPNGDARAEEYARSPVQVHETSTLCLGRRSLHVTGLLNDDHFLQSCVQVGLNRGS